MTNAPRTAREHLDHVLQILEHDQTTHPAYVPGIRAVILAEEPTLALILRTAQGPSEALRRWAQTVSAEMTFTDARSADEVYARPYIEAYVFAERARTETWIADLARRSERAGEQLEHAVAARFLRDSAAGATSLEGALAAIAVYTSIHAHAVAFLARTADVSSAA